jgi:uncharacterized protein (TIGR02302 family)
MHLTGGEDAKAPISIPEGSTLKIRVYSPLGDFLPPEFGNGDVSKTMAYLGEGLYSTDDVIHSGDMLRVTQALIPRAHWKYTFIKDEPPVISLPAPPKDEAAPEEKQGAQSEKSEPEEKPLAYEMLANKNLRFALDVMDDYSVTELDMRMRIDPVVEDIPLGEDFTDTRLVMSPPKTIFQISPVYDLTWHTWAGLPVIFEFSAKDHKGQISNLPAITLTLPERGFEHPVAKSLIAARKKLAWSKNYDFVPLASDLESLLSAPDFLQNNPVVYLAIKTAAARLYQSESMNEAEQIKTANAIVRLLWDAAITIEDGTLSIALRELRDAQKELENAMRDPQSTEEQINRLMENMQEKIQQYFAEMQKEMQKRMAEGQQFPMISPDQFGQMISPESLSSFLEQLQQALKSGNKDKAQEMLSQLQRMMDMMDPSMATPMPKDMQMMSEGVNELQELIDRQQALLDQTNDQADLQAEQEDREGNPFAKDFPSNSEILKKFGIENFPPAPHAQKDKSGTDENARAKNPMDTQQNKAEQESLRYVLGQLMMDIGEELPEIPEGMGKAEQEMRGAENKLGKNNPRGAVPHQEKAIEHLKESQEQLSQQLQQRMQQMVGVGLSGGMRYDPLGRPYGGQNQGKNQNPDEKVKIPAEAQRKRAEEILRLLRDRSGEFDRPSEELEYYRRLLRQF